MSVKIGILLPRSDMYPTLAQDYLQGLKLAVHAIPNLEGTPTYVVESIGTAADDSVIKTAEKLLLQEEVALTFSFCGSFILDRLVKLFDAYKKPLIHIDLGGNLLEKEHISLHVVHHSLNLCAAAYASGRYAAEHYGKKAALLTSFYDGGYQIQASFDQGFTDAGGSTVYNHVNPMHYENVDFEDLIRVIENESPDVVFCNFSYKEGNKMLKVLADAPFNGKIPMLATSIMTDEGFVDTNYHLENMHSIASWSFDDPSTIMQEFIARYVDKSGKKPSIFSLLGFECGLLLSACLTDENSVPSEIGTYLNNRSIQTPRGEIHFNEYNESKPETFKVRQFQYNQLQYHNPVVDFIAASVSDHLNQKFQGLSLSGWKNPYICT